MKTTKRQYHPLVIYGFHAGLLKDEQLKLIPNSTLSYWHGFNHKEYFGYEWVQDYIETDIEAKVVTKRKVGMTVIRFVGRMYKCYDELLADTKSFKRIIKKNAGMVVASIDKMNGYIHNLKLCCKLVKISVTQYYRLKNKVHCTASVLSLCYKTHTAQLSVREATVIKDNITNPENRNRPLSSLYSEMLRAGKLACSLSTLYKYAAILFPGKRYPRKIIKYDSFKVYKSGYYTVTARM